MGSIYALGAIGVTFIFSIMRHAHFAHGDMATLGAFLAFAGIAVLGLPPYVALLPSIVATGLIAIGIDKIFYSYLRQRPKIITTISSLGIALMIRSAVQMVWGVDTRMYVSGISRRESWYGIKIKSDEIITVGSVLICVTALVLFLNKTKWGKALRAMSNNRDLALLSGVDNEKVVMLTWMISGGLCAASGFFLGINTELRSMMGWNILLPTFAAAILGGVGRIGGAVAGGLIVGIVAELSVMVIASEYKSLSSLAIVLLVLIFRPTGLFKGKVL